MDQTKKGRPPGLPKTGGRQKGSGGRRLFLTIPPNIAKWFPENDEAARKVILEALENFANKPASED